MARLCKAMPFELELPKPLRMRISNMSSRGLEALAGNLFSWWACYEQLPSLLDFYLAFQQSTIAFLVFGIIAKLFCRAGLLVSTLEP